MGCYWFRWCGSSTAGRSIAEGSPALAESPICLRRSRRSVRTPGPLPLLSRHGCPLASGDDSSDDKALAPTNTSTRRPAAEMDAFETVYLFLKNWLISITLPSSPRFWGNNSQVFQIPMLILSRLSSPSPSAKGSTSNADRSRRWALLAKPTLGVALAMGVLIAGQAQAMVVNLGEQDQQDWNVTTFSGTYNDNPNFAIVNNLAPPTSANDEPVVSGDLNQPDINTYTWSDPYQGSCPVNFSYCPRTGFTLSNLDLMLQRMCANRPELYCEFNFFNVVKPPSSDYSTLPFTGSLNTTIFNVVTLSAPPTTPVPGPLPALGAAAAFGFSRKLRKRIKRSPNAVSSTYSL